MSPADSAGSLRPPGTRRAGSASRRLPWAYMAPSLIVLGALTIGPAIFVIYSAFRNDKVLGGHGKFVGPDNFISAVTNPSTQHSFWSRSGSWWSSSRSR